MVFICLKFERKSKLKYLQKWNLITLKSAQQLSNFAFSYNKLSIYERLFNDYKHKQIFMSELEKKYEMKEGEKCTFTPKINSIRYFSLLKAKTFSKENSLNLHELSNGSNEDSLKCNGMIANGSHNQLNHTIANGGESNSESDYYVLGFQDSYVKPKYYLIPTPYECQSHHNRNQTDSYLNSYNSFNKSASQSNHNRRGSNYQQYVKISNQNNTNKKKKILAISTSFMNDDINYNPNNSTNKKYLATYLKTSVDCSQNWKNNQNDISPARTSAATAAVTAGITLKNPYILDQERQQLLRKKKSSSLTSFRTKNSESCSTIHTSGTPLQRHSLFNNYSRGLKNYINILGGNNRSGYDNSSNNTILSLSNLNASSSSENKQKTRKLTIGVNYDNQKRTYYKNALIKGMRMDEQQVNSNFNSYMNKCNRQQHNSTLTKFTTNDTSHLFKRNPSFHGYDFHTELRKKKKENRRRNLKDNRNSVFPFNHYFNNCYVPKKLTITDSNIASEVVFQDLSQDNNLLNSTNKNLTEKNSINNYPNGNKRNIMSNLINSISNNEEENCRNKSCSLKSTNTFVLNSFGDRPIENNNRYNSNNKLYSEADSSNRNNIKLNSYNSNDSRTNNNTPDTNAYGYTEQNTCPRRKNTNIYSDKNLDELSYPKRLTESKNKDKENTTTATRTIQTNNNPLQVDCGVVNECFNFDLNSKNTLSGNFDASNTSLQSISDTKLYAMANAFVPTDESLESFLRKKNNNVQFSKNY